MDEIAIVYDIPEPFIYGFFFILALGSGELEDIRKIKIVTATSWWEHIYTCSYPKRPGAPYYVVPCTCRFVL